MLDIFKFNSYFKQVMRIIRLMNNSWIVSVIIQKNNLEFVIYSRKPYLNINILEVVSLLIS